MEQRAAIDEININSGTQFDPNVVNAFIEIIHGIAYYKEVR